jgi:hypothetical protein
MSELPTDPDSLLYDGKSRIYLTPETIKKWKELGTISDHLFDYFFLDDAEPLFHNVDTSQEFGVVRFIADQMNHLPSLLEEASVDKIGPNEYIIKAKKDLDSDGIRTLIFSHPLTAQTDESAREIAEMIKGKLLGIRHKMWQACWLYANEVKETQFSASVHDLMKACYPERSAKFSSKEKENFYEELRLLRFAEFTLRGETALRNGKSVEYKYNIPILRVGGSVGEIGVIDGPPDKVFIDLCAITPPPIKEKMRFVAARIKRRTLELHAQDCPIAFHLQLRKNQILGGSEESGNHADFKIEHLVITSGLQKTYQINPTVGIKRLLEKISRAQDKGIIKKFKRIEKNVRVWW